MAIKEFDTSLLIWMYNKSLEAIVEDDTTKEVKIIELIELKKQISDYDYYFKIQFKSGKKIVVEDVDSNEEQEDKFSKGVRNLFKQMGTFLLNCETYDQYLQLNKSLQILQKAIEKEINLLQGNQDFIESENEIGSTKNKTKHTLLKQKEVVLLIRCLQKQHYITDSPSLAGSGFKILTGYSNVPIENDLPSKEVFFTDEQIDKMIKNFYEIIGYLEDLKIDK